VGHIDEAETCYRTSMSLKRDIEADPTLIETRISSSFWESIEDDLRRFLQKYRNLSTRGHDVPT
ncbi:MAG: hypothetical protein Q6373_005250, partial [Candidatus Sigynarchaeota archaeon]